MDIEQLEKRLEFWKRGLLVGFGASVTLLAITLAESSRDISWGWYFVCVVIWLAVAPPGFYLLMNKKWRKVPLSSRLNVAFGYLGCAWLVLLSADVSGFQSCNLMTLTGSGEWVCSHHIAGWDMLTIITIFILGAAYWYLRKKKDKPEEIFP